MKAWAIAPWRILQMHKILNGKVAMRYDGIPADATVIDWAVLEDKLVLLIYSNEWPEVPEGENIPGFTMSGIMAPLPPKLQIDKIKPPQANVTPKRWSNGTTLGSSDPTLEN